MWPALAIIFALLPGLAALGYMDECSMHGQDQSLHGFWRMFRQFRKAEKGELKQGVETGTQLVFTT